MDAARKPRPDQYEGSNNQPDSPESRISMEGLEKVLRLSFPPREAETRQKLGFGLNPTEIGRAIELVQEAAETIRAGDERVRESEARTQAIVMRAAEEIKAAEARVLASENRAKAAEARLQDTEGRLREAEAWLRQIFSAITEELPTRRNHSEV